MAEHSQVSVYLDDGEASYARDGRSLSARVSVAMPSLRVRLCAGKASELAEALCEAEIEHHVEMLRSLQRALVSGRPRGAVECASWDIAVRQVRRWGLGLAAVDDRGWLDEHLYVDGEPHVVTARTTLARAKSRAGPAVAALLQGLIARKRAELERFYRGMLGELEGRLRRN